MAQLHIVMSDLLGSWPAPQLKAASAGLDVSLLERVLSRAVCHEISGPPAHLPLLTRLFDWPADQDVPVAALTSLIDRPGHKAAYTLRADPVHLKADRDRVVLYRARDLAVTDTEAQQLVTDINTQLAEPGWQLSADHPSRWYVDVVAPPEGLITQPPDAALGQDIFPCQPSGASGGLWRRRINEIQMLLHEHPLNVARAAHGQHEINSLWLWGGGVLPESAPRLAWHQVFTADPLAAGLARCCNIRLIDQAMTAEQLLSHLQPGAPQLLIIERGPEAIALGDGVSWRQRLEQWTNDWLSPLLKAMTHGEIEELILYPGNGRSYQLTRWRWRLGWRPRPLAGFAAG
ncbi:MAG: hypothetical protein HY940_04595 [Gammaproteobacteria bacterium]|nr:hypothetical protein [Gammaproteobacteria bacterium]